MDLKRAKQIKKSLSDGGLDRDASVYEVDRILDLAIQKLSEREALRKKAAKRRKMMKRGVKP